MSLEDDTDVRFMDCLTGHDAANGSAPTNGSVPTTALATGYSASNLSKNTTATATTVTTTHKERKAGEKNRAESEAKLPQKKNKGRVFYSSSSWFRYIVPFTVPFIPSMIKAYNIRVCMRTLHADMIV